MLDFLKQATVVGLDDSDLNTAYEYSQELYQVIYSKKDKILQYEATSDQSEQDLIDLLVLTEIVGFSVMSIGLQPNQIDSQQQELSNSVERLTQKMS